MSEEVSHRMSERMSDWSQNRCQIECQIKYHCGDHSKKVICELYADMFAWPVSTRSWNFSASLCFLDVQMQAYVHRYCYDVQYLYIFTGLHIQLRMRIQTYNVHIPVVPHKAVAEVSKIGNL